MTRQGLFLSHSVSCMLCSSSRRFLHAFAAEDVCHCHKPRYSYCHLTGFLILVFVLWYDLLRALTDLIGAATATTTLFIFGIIFLMMITLHFAIEISSLSDQVKNLAQKVSLLEAERDGEQERGST